jgi:hypothetical protein
MTRDEALSRIMSDDEMREWVESRPDDIRAMVERMPPGTWWRIKGQTTAIYTPVSYAEDGTLTVHRHDLMMPVLAYQVFGCHPDDFEWTELDESAGWDDIEKLEA